MSNVKRPKQACDLCRARKRKCDGAKPVCAPCAKAASKSKNGHINCNYSNGPAARNSPSKLHEVLLAKLESMENLLAKKDSTIVISSKSIEDRVKFLSDNILKANSELLGPKEMDIRSNITLDSLDISQTNTSPSIASELLTGTSGASRCTFQTAMRESIPFLTKISNLSNYPSPDINRDEVAEEHLIRISRLFYTGYSVDQNLSTCMLADRPKRLSPLLRKALCFQSIFFSTHPTFFGVNKKPVFIDRLNASRQFMLPENYREMIRETNILVDSSNNQEVCDDIRALLIYTWTSFSLGNMSEAYNTAFLKGQMTNIFNPATFSSNANKRTPILTCDHLMSLSIRPMIDTSGFCPLTDQDRLERYTLWLHFLIIDSYLNMIYGSGYLIDESLLSMVSYPTFQPFRPPHTGLPKRTLATNTIWEDCPFALLFDDVIEMKTIITRNLPNPAFLVEAQCNLALLGRRVLRFSRSDKSRLSINELSSHTLLLHNLILAEMVDLPHTYVPFTSFEFFTPEKPELDASLMTPLVPMSSDFLQLILTRLTMFSFLHLPTAQMGVRQLYPLTHQKYPEYSTPVVFITSLKCAAYLIKLSRFSGGASHSTFNIHGYPSEQLSQCLEKPLDDTLPSPILSCAANVILLYISVSASLIGLRIPPVNPDYLALGTQVANTVIIPHLNHISTVWPLAAVFAKKIGEILQGGDAEFWSSQTYYV
ncbi:hypothetical protein HDV02_002411 [Globomyces sp. JEL0801]|nr:hypothetical protein HDV02_002411 [Globomyces sp. JEL0801]